MQMRFKFFGRVAQVYVEKMPDMFTVGLENVLEDDSYVLFLDYDCVNYPEVVKKDIEHLHRVFRLCTFVVLESSIQDVKGEICGMDGEGEIANYHVICLCKGSYQDVCEWVQHSRCDPKYRSLGWRHSRRAWVLRFAAKTMLDNEKKLVKPATRLKEVIEYNCCGREHSDAMGLFAFINWSAVFESKAVESKEWDGQFSPNLISYGVHKPR